jgi:hypothetical protein
MLRLFLAATFLAAVPATCGNGFEGPGQGAYRATLTVLNRTEAELIVTSAPLTFSVPPCDEVTVDDVEINSWRVSSPGRDSIRAAGGHAEAHSYLIVTGTVRQDDTRPDPLPKCEGLLPPLR